MAVDLKAGNDAQGRVHGRAPAAALVGLLAFLLAAGCAPKAAFVYKPSDAAAGAGKIPMNIAVLPFADGTENFTKRGNAVAPEGLSFNLAKTGMSGLNALTPDLWAKSLADELGRSGGFRGVRFFYDRTEIVDEDCVVDGTLEKATATLTASDMTYKFTLTFTAHRRADGSRVWNKKVDGAWRDTSLFECGAFAFQCMADRHHAQVNRAMREIFATARADLLAALAPVAGGRDASDDAVSPDNGPDETIGVPHSGPVDETIGNILQGP